MARNVLQMFGIFFSNVMSELPLVRSMHMSKFSVMEMNFLQKRLSKISLVGSCKSSISGWQDHVCSPW